MKPVHATRLRRYGPQASHWHKVTDSASVEPGQQIPMTSDSSRCHVRSVDTCSLSRLGSTGPGPVVAIASVDHENFV
jgi:hypothetical protein